MVAATIGVGGENSPRGQAAVPLVAGTLAASDGGMAIDRVGELVPVAFSCKNDGVDLLEDVSPTLRAMSHADSHSNGGGQVAVFARDPAFAITTPRGSGDCHGNAWNSNYVAYSIQGANSNATEAHAVPVDVARCLDGSGVKGNQGGTVVASARPGVRRLLPVENERLQGFPDDWTRWGVGGVELPDAARYRMTGNAVAVPVVEWIGRRLVEASR